MKKLVINFSNKTFYTLVTIGILIFGGSVIYAYTTDGSGNPAVMGHSVDEIDLGPITVSGENVGIGTMVPNKLLEISSNNYPTFRLTNEDTDTTTNDIIGAIEFYTEEDFGSLPGVAGAIHSVVESAPGSDNGMAFFTTSAENPPTEQMRITHVGYVGIGTTSPEVKLHVRGEIMASGGDQIYHCPKLKSGDSECTSNCIGQLTLDSTCTYWYDDGSGSGWACFGSSVHDCSFVGRLVSDQFSYAAW